MSTHKPAQRPPPAEELLAQFDLLSHYAGHLNDVKRFTPDTLTGRPETVAMHTLRLTLSTVALLASSGASWGTIGRAAVYALVHDLAEMTTGDVVTLGGLTPDQRADKGRREEEAIAEIRAEMIAAAPTSGHVITDLLREYERRDHMASQFVHLLDKILPSIQHTRDGSVKLHMRGWTPERFAESRQQQLAELRAACGINETGTAAEQLDPEHEALLLALDEVYRLADARVIDHLRIHARLDDLLPDLTAQTPQTPGDEQP